MRKAILAVGVVGLAVTFAALVGPLGGASDQRPQAATDPGTARATPTPAPSPTATGTDRPTATATGPSPTAGSPSTASPAPRERTPTAGSSHTPSPTPAFAEPSLDAAVNETNLSRAIVEEINAERSSQGLDPLVTYVDPVVVLEDMAETHSERMAELGAATHAYNGTDSEDRYRNRSLFQTCVFESNGGGHVVTAELNRLELVDSLDGSGYATGSVEPRRLHDRIASDLVDAWFGDRFERTTLRYENAEWIGVGVEVTPDEAVYVTVNVC